MDQIEICIENFLYYCTSRRKLSTQTVRGYGFDLRLFTRFLGEQMPSVTSCPQITKDVLEAYLDYLSDGYKVKSIKRKIACIRSFCRYLEYEEIIESNPFQKFRLEMKEGFRLPKTMALSEVDSILRAAYDQNTRGPGEEFTRIRDAAILELLFAGGLRVSELCRLTFADLDLAGRSFAVHGKGNNVTGACKRRPIFIFICYFEITTISAEASSSSLMS